MEFDLSELSNNFSKDFWDRSEVSQACNIGLWSRLGIWALESSVDSVLSETGLGSREKIEVANCDNTSCIEHNIDELNTIFRYRSESETNHKTV